jgi:PAS domain S-box-containing protein
MPTDADPGALAGLAAEPSLQACLRRIRELEAQLEESEETLEAIRRGEIDAVVVKDASAERRVYTLENADRPYRVLIEQIQEGAVTLGADGTVFYCNRRLAEMLGTPQERVIGQKLQPFIRQDDLAVFERLLESAGRDHARGELTIRGPGGAEIPVYLSLSFLQSDDGRPVLCGVLADLTQQTLHLRALSEANARLMAESTQREAIEEALRQSQKMEAVGQLTGGLAHDFNNLLTVIVGSLELLLSNVAEGNTTNVGRYVSAAMESADRGAALTHRLLAFSRRQPLDPKLVLPNRLVAGIVELLQRTVGPTMTVETVLPGGVGPILCDQNQLENALLNLAINARDAMPQGGRLTITTANVELDAAFAAQRDMLPGHYVTLTVADTGTGMSPTVLARAFDPFFTTKPIGQGTGLGLSMIYGFAKQSGGQVRIESKEDVGTTVCLYLPRHRHVVPLAVEARPPRKAPQAGAGETVLVVEDEAGIRMLVVNVLEKLGYLTMEAADAKGGLRHVEAGARIDLLVTDVGLPGGMNGRQFAEAARAQRPGLHVLFMTGFAETAAAGTGAMGQGMEVIAKPFRMEAFAAKVRTMINDGAGALGALKR